MKFHHVGQAGLELLTSGDPPASASRNVGIMEVRKLMLVAFNPFNLISRNNHRDDRWSDDHYEREKREVDWNFHKDSFFCDVPSDRYSRVVFTSSGGETLWNLPAIKSMCNVDNSR
ncbi:Protein dispatched-like protein 1, partial [Plecturocebus cupreus]